MSTHCLIDLFSLFQFLARSRAADIVKISLVPDLNTHNSMLTASDGEDNPSRDDKRFTKANNK